MDAEPLPSEAATLSTSLPEHPAPHKWLITAAVLLGAILVILDGSIVNVALPYMQRTFSVGIDRISWVVTSYLAAVSVMLPMTGWLAVRIGRRRYLIISVLTFVIASAMCGLAQSITEIVVFRILQGIAGAAMMPLSQAILLETFPVEEHPLAMTTFGIGMMAAPVLGPTLGGWITETWSWRWCFYINVPTGAFAALMMYTFVHDPDYLREQRGSGRVDYLGIVLIALTLGVFQIVLGRGGRDGWFAAPWVRYCSAITVLSGILLVIRELRHPEPIIDLRMFGIFGFTLAVMLISLQGLALWTINYLNPLFLETVLHYSALDAGWAVAWRGVGVVVALFAIGQLSRRGWDTRGFVCVGFVIGAYEAWNMSHWTLNTTSMAIVLPILFIGLGLGAVFPTVTALGIGQIQRERMGFAASLFSMMINTGAAAGIALATNLLTVRHHLHLAQLGGLSDATHIDSTMLARSWLFAYNDVYRVIAVLLILLAPWCLLLKRRDLRDSTEIALEAEMS